jgi:glycerol uptake facilitator-like aquaporin
VHHSVTLTRRLVGEFIGSALLSAIVIGSGIAAQELSPHDVGLELLVNALVTGAGLYVLILVFSPVSGAHFNPVVSLVNAALGAMRWLHATLYVPVQILGCVAGALLANTMFALSAVTISTHHRASGPHLWSEVIATFGLILVIFSLARNGHHAHTPAAVGGYIAAAYFFTSSTSFANPAIAVGRMFSNTFAGIAPSSVPAFILAELVGGTLSWGLVKYLFPVSVLVPRTDLSATEHS